MVDMGIVKQEEESSFLREDDGEDNENGYNESVNVSVTQVNGAVNESLPYITNLS